MAVGDPRAVAQRLIAEFGSLSAVLAGSSARLSRVLAGEPAVAAHLRRVRVAMLQSLRSDLDERPLLAHWHALIHYLRADMATLAWERVRILHLDAAHHLIRDEITCDGAIDEVALNPSTVLRRAIELGSASVIVVHNHPSGNPEPSKADITATQRLCRGASAVGIVVHGHIIVAARGETSMRQSGLL